MASVEPASGGAGPGGRKGDPAEGQSAGWHSQLPRAKLSMCRNELCSTALKQTGYLNVLSPYDSSVATAFNSTYKVLSRPD